MQQLLEFTDSEVSRVVRAHGTVCIVFAAAHVRRVADVASAPIEQGYAHSVEITVAGAGDESAALGADFIGRIFEGRVAVAGSTLSRIPLPCAMDGPVQLQLSFANRSELSVCGNSLVCRFTAESNYTESLAC